MASAEAPDANGQAFAVTSWAAPTILRQTGFDTPPPAPLPEVPLQT